MTQIVMTSTDFGAMLMCSFACSIAFGLWKRDSAAGFFMVFVLWTFIAIVVKA